MPEPRRVRVCVVCAEPSRAFSAEFDLPEGATVADAIERSGIGTARPDIEIRADRLGIFARKVKPDQVLQDGDRVEVYRPLRVDPKEARRRRARGGRSADASK